MFLLGQDDETLTGIAGYKVVVFPLGQDDETLTGIAGVGGDAEVVVVS